MIPFLISKMLLAGLLVSSDTAVDYQKQVRPVFQTRCFACHGALKQESGLRVDTAASAIQGGDSGSAIVAGNSAASLLLRRISTTDPAERMPPEGEPLKQDEIEAIRRWIDEGAKAPAGETPETDPGEHWAFKTPVRPQVPTADRANWILNPIDAFIAAAHQQQGLIPQPAADRRTWLRRVSLDLTGLPPTPGEQDAFLSDGSPDAFEKVVTRLLDSPQYGERWGRHWMDIWRYSDWWGLGAEVRNSQKHIWHWRDWIIESLNDDKPYDQMLREMLAADELYPNDLDRLRGSGFLARQYFKFNRTSWMDETLEHTSKAMLGLTVNCCKCHDHKYDPISQVEYYQMRAFFEPYQIRTDAVPGELDFEKDGIPRAFDCNPDIPTFVHIRGDDRNPDTSRLITPAVPKFLSTGELGIQPVSLPVEASHPGLRSHVIEAYIATAEAGILDARKSLETSRQKLAESERAETQKHAEDPLPVDQAKLVVRAAEKALLKSEAEPESVRARAAAERARLEQPDSPVTKNLIAAAVRAESVVTVAKAEEDLARAQLAVVQASPEKSKEAETRLVEAGVALEKSRKILEMPSESFTPLSGAIKTLESNLETEESRRKPFPRSSTGRRSAFAGWITDPRHPLPARVAVNHIWARHFGRGLVSTVFDFGRKGAPPTHPELLDWLAVELVDNAWSMKHIHRLIVLSNTYRMSSSGADAAEVNLSADPDNRLYWRRSPVRMEAQVVRDSLLSLAGELNLSMGGPSIPVIDENSRRRSLYYVHSHNEHQQFLSMFDDASVLECYRRAESIVPQQALALENSTLAGEMAGRIVQQIETRWPGISDDEFIRECFRGVLSTEPTLAEAAASLEALSQFYLAAQAADPPSPRQHARVGFLLALLNHNDFVTIR